MTTLYKARLKVRMRTSSDPYPVSGYYVVLEDFEGEYVRRYPTDSPISSAIQSALNDVAYRIHRLRGRPHSYLIHEREALLALQGDYMEKGAQILLEP